MPATLYIQSNHRNLEDPKSARTIAYIVSRFPAITETFILYEILELERRGINVEVFSLLRQREPVMHREAEELVKRAHYGRLLSPRLIEANLYWLLKRPRAYLGAWRRAVRGNRRTARSLAHAAYVVAQAALFARWMQRKRIEHVHAHWATHPTLAAYVIRRLTGLRYSFTAHAHDIYLERPMLEEKIRDASFVVTISDYNRQLLGRLYGKLASEKTVMIRCGVDPEVFLPRSRPPRAKDQPLAIVCVASLRDYKGHPYLLEACSHLRDRAIWFECLLIGEGEDRPAIEAQIARAQLSDSVKLLGQQPRDRVSEILSNADVMVLPSVVTPYGKKEGIPVALMEALAAELPVIATAISGIPELLEDGRTGLLVPERDARALANALVRLYENPTLGRRLAKAGREKVLREFNLQRNVAALGELLSRNWAAEVQPAHSIIAGSHPRPGGTQPAHPTADRAR
jgi:colanic acid/amylovoran biosynthesis glycosyltransferase